MLYSILIWWNNKSYSPITIYSTVEFIEVNITVVVSLCYTDFLNTF